MDCPSHEHLMEYSGDALGPVERMMVKDHLVVCPRCRRIVAEEKTMEQALRLPVMLEPPMDLEKKVMKALFPRTPSRVSLTVLGVFSFALFVSLIMVIFDVSNNGVLRTLELGGAETTGLLGALIRAITGSFKVIYSVYKVIDAFVRVMSFGVMSFETFLILLSLPAFLVTAVLIRKRSRQAHGKSLR